MSRLHWFLCSRFYKGKIKVSARRGSDQEVLGRTISKVIRGIAMFSSVMCRTEDPPSLLAASS